MSGGHWGYLADKIRDAVEDDEGARRLMRSGMRLMADIEHELDWGHSCDTCLACARLRVLDALDVYFDALSGNLDSELSPHDLASSILRNRTLARNVCTEDLERDLKQPGDARYRPSMADISDELAKRRERDRLRR